MEPSREALAAAGQDLGCALNEAEASALLNYLLLLERWNRAFNLTAIRDRSDMMVTHIVDSLSVIAPLRRYLSGRPAHLLDVGSGGGLPGVVIAITCPEICVTCVDSVGKKAGFVRQVSAELGLVNLRVVHSRVEAVSGLNSKFDVIVARAFSSLAKLVDLTKSLPTPTGVWLAMKGRFPEAEIKGLPQEIRVFHVEPLAVPMLEAERCLIWLRRAAENHVLSLTTP